MSQTTSQSNKIFMAQETQNVTQELNETWEKGKSPLEKNNF
jgi:hypothetical protein